MSELNGKTTTEKVKKDLDTIAGLLVGSEEGQIAVGVFMDDVQNLEPIDRRRFGFLYDCFASGEYKHN
tara:strand:- start:1001 stop:1204 length:204 start_codon:yes stop_codon:yes gene_type:complete